MTPDLVNGLFEALGGLLMWLNVQALHKSKRVEGISWIPTGFFTLWGLWNCAFYPMIGQWWSFFGGLSIVVANSVWWAQLIYYRRQNNGRSERTGHLRVWPEGRVAD